MKHLLLLFILSSFSFISLQAQAPPNDLVQNAILIDESPFVDVNVRIPNATLNNGGQIDCAVTGFRVVHYKFFADENKNVTITIDSNGNMTSVFAIVYTAANLNAVNNSELTLASNCAFATIINNQATVNFAATANTNYYIIISSDTAFSNITIDIPQDVDASEKTALLDLYTNTDNDGSGWTVDENWNSNTPVSTWSGITVKNGHVSKINLRGNNLNGSIPNTLENLSFLEEVDLANNRLEGELPDLGKLNNINKLWVRNNNFSFLDLETNYSSNINITDFNYQTQNKKDTEDVFDGIIGNNYMLSISDIPGTNVQYQWYKKRYQYFVNSDEPILTATNKDFVINSLTNSDMDVYICKATSPIITDLIIERNSIEIRGEVSQVQKDALTAIYNSTNGDSWNNNSNWLSNEPLSTWHGVTVKGNKITELNFTNNNLTGNLPSEIGDLFGLEYLSFYLGNNISGNLPSEIGNLTELRVLSVEFNNFTGEIPASYSNLNKLSGFWFNNNQLSGNVPEFLKTFNNLAFLDVSYNQFSGTLPDFSSLPNLRWLNISSNYFNATNFIAQFEDYKNLQYNWNDSNFYYSPQFTQDTAEETFALPGSSVTLTLTDVPNTTRPITNNKSILASNTYQWYKDNNPITGANANSYTINNAQISDSGIYYCTILNADIPDLIIERQPITLNIGALSVEDIEIDTIKAYPNPVTNILNIKLNNTEVINSALYDISGKRVLNLELHSELTVIDLSNLSPGIYLLKMDKLENTVVKRIIKQ